MIPRYARKEAAEIWSAQTRYRIWFEIEAHAADAMAEIGTIPKRAAETIWAKGKDAVWDPDRIDEIERTTKHDVIAFLTHVAEIVSATDLPVSADLENGFGDRPETVAETIRMAAATGLVGGSIEDSTQRPEQPIYELELAVERIRAAAEGFQSDDTLCDARPAPRIEG